MHAFKLSTTIYSDEENVSKQPQSDENLFVERRSEQSKWRTIRICRAQRRQRKIVVTVSEAVLKNEYITPIP
jgi:translation initiation factor 1 (eIF-1/SUI1)